MTEISAGGVIVFGNTVLMLRRFNGDWVLPKGRKEKNETLEETAIREVFEESGVRAHIVQYIDKVNYHFRRSSDSVVISKEVYWYLMSSDNMECVPQKSEGFIVAQFVHVNKVFQLVKYSDEKEIIKKALALAGVEY